MKLTLTVTESETSVKDGVRSTRTVASASDERDGIQRACSLTLEGPDDLLCKVGSTIDLQFTEPREPRTRRSFSPNPAD